jgi:hypothetical protein
VELYTDSVVFFCFYNIKNLQMCPYHSKLTNDLFRFKGSVLCVHQQKSYKACRFHNIITITAYLIKHGRIQSKQQQKIERH